MAEVVLDGSAILAVLNAESGVEVVEPLLRGSHASTLVIAEVAGKLIARGIDAMAARTMLDTMEIRSHDFTPARAFAAAGYCADRNALRLSLADRACIALAAELGLPALTGDRLWADVDLPIEVRLIR